MLRYWCILFAIIDFYVAFECYRASAGIGWTAGFIVLAVAWSLAAVYAHGDGVGRP